MVYVVARVANGYLVSHVENNETQQQFVFESAKAVAAHLAQQFGEVVEFKDENVQAESVPAAEVPAGAENVAA